MSDSSTNTNYSGLAAKALTVGIIGLLIAGFGLVNGVNEGDSRPLFSWLLGITYWLNIGVGCLFLPLPAGCAEPVTISSRLWLDWPRAFRQSIPNSPLPR